MAETPSAQARTPSPHHFRAKMLANVDMLLLTPKNHSVIMRELNQVSGEGVGVIIPAHDIAQIQATIETRARRA